MDVFYFCESCRECFDGTEGFLTCVICGRVQHCSCAGYLQSYLSAIAGYHCALCENTFGETEYKNEPNSHRRNFLENEADDKPVQNSTERFIEEIKYFPFASVDGVVKILDGNKLTISFLQDYGFNAPIIVRDVENLGMKLPPHDFGVSTIYELVGREFLVDVVDVTQHINLQMKFKDFSSYFYSASRKFPACVPCLDFSNPKLDYLVQPPSVAKELDWIERYCPKDSSLIKPCLQKYCSVSTKDAFNDFQITLGGSSVWYHIFEGEKVFYMIEPSEKNLLAFQAWMSSPNKSETFLASKVNGCYQLFLSKGETIFLPTGWIYASLALSDSLIFGGNFLSDLNIPFQLRIHDLDYTSSKGNSFFPMFELVNMHAAFHFVEELQKLIEKKAKIPERKVFAVKILSERIKFWVHTKDHKIFKHMNKFECQKLVKDLTKQVKQAERLNKSLRMIRPEIGMIKTAPVEKDLTKSVLKEGDKIQKIKMTLKILQTPVKLTLPKPSTYPYRNNKIAQAQCEAIGKVPEANGDIVEHPWSIADASHSNGDLKIKLRIGRQSPDVVKSKSSSSFQSTSEPSFQPRFEPNVDTNDNVDTNEERDPLEIEPNSSQLPGQNQVSEQATAFIEARNIAHDDADNSDGSSSDIEVVFVSEGIQNRQNRSLETSSHTSGNNDENGVKSCDDPLSLPCSSSSSAMNLVPTPTGIVSPLNYLVPSKPEGPLLSLTPTDISEILASSSIGLASCISVMYTPRKKTAYKGKRNAGLRQIEESHADEPMPTTSQNTGGPVKSTISLTSEAEGKLSICSTSRPYRKKKVVSRQQNRKNFSLLDDGHVDMGRVHEDDSFVYLSLETSDEDDEPVRKFRGKQYIDETWSPGARVGPLLPRVEKPVRDVKRNQAIEKGLEAAAAKKAGLPPPKRQYHIRKKRVPKMVASSATVTTGGDTETSGIAGSSCVITTKQKSKKLMKPKRGMATAKQRLGKILKINKLSF